MTGRTASMRQRHHGPLHDLARVLLALVLWTNLWGAVLAAQAGPGLDPAGALCIALDPEEAPQDGKASRDGHWVLCQLPSLAGEPVGGPQGCPSRRAAPERVAWGRAHVPAAGLLHPSDVRRFHGPPALS